MQAFNVDRILIIGDSGRGKSTLAQKLSLKLNIEYYSTDDFFWAKKYSIKANKQKSVSAIEKVYSKKKWIVEGSTRHLIKTGLERSHMIIYLQHKSLFYQYWIVLKRYCKRDEESLFELMNHMVYLFKKRFNLGKDNVKKSLNEMISPYKNKTVILHSFEEINKFLNEV